jgi:CPA1 family monovalent cation:H+ antiporter
MKRAGITGELQHRLAGESVLCGGLAIIVYLVLLTLTSTTDTTMLLSEKLLWQIGGSLLLGLLTGLGAYRLLRQLDDYQVEVLILLALVFGLLALAQHWFLYGPLALLSAGLVLGNHGQILAMSEKSRRHLHDFWELIGGLVNAVLLVLLMLEFLVIAPRFEFFLASLAILPAVLLARFIAMGVPVTVMRYFQAQAPGSVQIMTWGGLRGGISVALVLSLPAGIERDVFVMITAVIIIFSVLVQGLTFRSLVRHLGE